jgi:hypothetical protein
MAVEEGLKRVQRERAATKGGLVLFGKGVLAFLSLTILGSRSAQSPRLSGAGARAPLPDADDNECSTPPSALPPFYCTAMNLSLIDPFVLAQDCPEVITGRLRECRNPHPYCCDSPLT